MLRIVLGSVQLLGVYSCLLLGNARYDGLLSQVKP
jgi:hypothetical protein